MIHFDNPGSKSWYPSSGPWNWDGSFEGCGPWYSWCCALGYPNLDIQQWKDGEWAIIEFYNAPNIPSMTRWNFMLHGMRNVEISPGFLQHHTRKLDLRREEIWAEYDARDKKQDEEKAALDRHAEDTAERAKNIIMQTPTLVERIAKNGLGEMDLDKIYKHIPRHQLIGYKGPK
jgi:hypothetical protein